MINASRRIPLCVALPTFLLTAAPSMHATAQEDHRVRSPDGRTEVTFELAEGRPSYRVDRDGRAVVLSSALGIELRGAPPLGEDVVVEDVTRRDVDETWTQPWGELSEVRNRFREMRVVLAEREGSRPDATPRRLHIVFRVFDDGLGFRYELPEQEGLGDFEITGELTQFALAHDGTAWWIPAHHWNRYELLYRSSPVSTLDTVHTPLTVRNPDGLHLAIHEADLTDYAAMNLTGSGDRVLGVDLPRWADGVAVKGRTPFRTPWRTLHLADSAADLVPATLELNLNDPPEGDFSWVRPMKYVGIWWGMHIGTMTWGSGPRHGATTANAKRYIDFAAEHGFDGVLVEGWNRGWDGEWSANADRFSFTEPYPDFDLEEVARYAAQRGVELFGHNETSMGVRNYEDQLEAAFALYRDLGVEAVKTGYVGDRTAEGHAHHGQYMVRHWRKVVETAARYGISLDVHEPVKDTGVRRTWPNMMTREGARGQEYNAWAGDGGNPPEHETILFFTRLLAGPMDFTPGVLDLELRSAPGDDRPAWAPRVRTTLAKQLALYVVVHSPLQMAADLPENYDAEDPAFDFIRRVPVDWADTRVLAGEVGDYVVVARRDRSSSEWWVGAITDEAGREVEVDLSFLLEDGGVEEAPRRGWSATVWADGPDAHWLHQPFDLDVSERPVDPTGTLILRLAPGGGQALRIRPAG